MSDADFNMSIDAELAEYFESLTVENAALAAKDARIAELEEALRPFANPPLYVFDDATNSYWVPHKMPADWIGGGSVSTADFRRARAVLEK